MKTAKVKSEFTFTMAFKALMWTLVVEEEEEDEDDIFGVLLLGVKGSKVR